MSTQSSAKTSFFGFQKNKTGFFVAFFLFAVVLSAVFTDKSGAHELSLSRILIILVGSVLVGSVLVCYVHILYGQLFAEHRSIFIVLVPASFLLLAIIEKLLNADLFANYGDDGQITGLLEAGVPFCRWLIGTSILVKLFKFFQLFYDALSAKVFAEMSGAVIMFLFSTFLIIRRRTQAMIILPLTTPVWVLFCLGYNEYYPFIAGIFVLVSIWLINRKPSEQLFFWAAIAGLLPVVYVGFVPLAGLVIIKLFFHRKSLLGFASNLLISAAVVISSAKVAWGGTLPSLLERLKSDLLIGDRGAVDEYIGKALPNIPGTFKIPYAFSLWHFQDLAFIALFSGGVAFLLFWVPFGSVSTKNYVLKLKNFRTDSLMLVLLVVSHLIFLLFYIPKLGPTRDIDLYFSTVLSISVCLGARLDQLFDSNNIDFRDRARTVSLIVASNSPLILALTVYGVQR